MEEEFLNLIEQLLACNNWEKVNQVLSSNQKLIVPELLDVMALVAEILADNGNPDGANFLFNLTPQLGEFLCSSQKYSHLRKETADVLLQIGIRFYQISLFALAIECWEEIIIIYREIKDRQGEANVLGNLGAAYDSLGQCQQAIDLYQQHLKVAREIKDRQGEAISLGNLGRAYFSKRQYEQAIDLYQQRLKIAREIKDRQGEANALGNLGRVYFSQGQYEQALEFHQQHLEIAREIKDRQGEANALGNLGRVYFSQGQYEQALGFHQQHLEIAREIKDRQGEANALGNLGRVYFSQGQYEQALEFHQQHLEIAREIKDRQGEANALGNLGRVYFSQGQYEQALGFHQQHLGIAREIKDHQGEANALGNLGRAYFSQGQYQQALEFHQKHLKTAREIKDHQGEANALGNLGRAYFSQGQYQQALEFHQKHLKTAREIKDRQGEANALGNLGNAYHALGRYERALEFHQQHLEIAREIKSRKGEAISLGNLGIAYSSLGKYELAIDFQQQSLEIVREIKYYQGEAYVLGNLGRAYRYLRQYEQAIESLQQSLEVAQEIKDRQGQAVALGNLGNIYRYLKQYEQAIDFHQRSLEIARAIKHRPGEADSLGDLGVITQNLGQYESAIAHFQESLQIATPKTMPVDCARNAGNLGYLYFTQGNWKKAIEAYTKAIEATEILRIGGLTDDRRQEILKNAIGVYANIIQCFVNTKQYAQALTYAEQSRNRQLVDFMYSKDVYYQEETPPEVAELLQQYEEIQRQIDNLRFNNEFPNNRETLSVVNPRQISASWQAKNDGITTLEAEKQEIYRKIRKFDQVLAEGLAVTPLEFSQLQNLVRDSSTTAIVSFFSTNEDTYTFILVGDRVDLHSCGQGYGELQRWLFQNWFEPYVWSEQPESDRLPISTIVVAKLLGCEINGIESAKPEKETVSILLKDGSTQSVDKAEFNKLRKQLTSIYDWHQQMPSNLKEISQRLQLDKLVEKLTGIQELIIIPHLYLHQIPFAALPLADNQYLGDKFLIRTQSSCQTLDFCTQRPPISTQTPAYGIVEDTQEDLPCSSFEAQKVAQIYNVATDKYLQGTTATVSTYKQLLQQVQGLLSSHHAKSRFDNGLESALILADGTITLSDLLSPAFRFPDLDEVFLSCCETNLGTTEITDDTMTLNTGFLCAGARGVISSLWAVDDLATSLFSLFYHQQRKAGFNRPQALQKAQQDLLHLTGKEFEREYYQELERLLNEKLQLASERKAAAKQKLDSCGENAPEYQQLQAEYEKRERLEKRISETKGRLKAVCQQQHPFEHPEYRSGFICAGLR